MLVLREAVGRLHLVHLFVQRQRGRGQHVRDGGVRGAVALMAAVVGVKGQDLRRRGVIAADGGLQDGWVVHKLLRRRRLDGMHRTGALDQGQNDEMSAFFSQRDRDGEAPRLLPRQTEGPIFRSGGEAGGSACHIEMIYRWH